MTKHSSLAALARFFKHKLEPEDQFFYESALASLSDHDVMEACGVAIKKCKWMPKPAELIGFAQEAVEPKALPAHPPHCPVCGGEYGHSEHDQVDPMSDTAREALEALYSKFGATMPAFDEDTHE